jgi:hypothetical protein
MCQQHEVQIIEPRKFSHDFQFPNNQRAKIMVEYYTLKIKRLQESSKIKFSANNYYKFNFFLKKENKYLRLDISVSKIQKNNEKVD